MKRGVGLCVRRLASLGLFTLLMAAPVLAQENQPSQADTSTGWIFRWINFAIVLALIAYGFYKARPAFRRHAEEISQRIAEGTRAREAAERQRREAEAKLAGIDAEVATLREDAKRGAAAEAERIRALAKSEAEMIERAGQAEIAAAERAARLELKTIAARMAVERAEALLRDEMTPSTESTLFHTFVTELERSAN